MEFSFHSIVEFTDEGWISFVDQVIWFPVVYILFDVMDVSWTIAEMQFVVSYRKRCSRLE
jgi:hypothetical protein